MHRARIATGTGNRSGKGGPKARLSFFLPLLSVLLVLPAPALRAAAGDPFEAALGVDYQRQLLPSSKAPHPLVGNLPGFEEPSAETPAFSADSARIAARLGLWRRDLIRKEGRFAFADARDLGSLDLAAALPGVRLRISADRNDRDFSMGDSAESLDMGEKDWGWRAAASIDITPWLVPGLIVGGISSSPHADALEALALRGSLPLGLEWSMAIGRTNIDYPVDLKLKGYSRLSFPFQLRQAFREAALGFRQGPWQAAWSGRWTRGDVPKVRPQKYSVSDSASAWRQSVQAGYDGLRPGAGWKAMANADLGMGDHVFQGITVKGNNRYPFSWQQGIQKDYSLRADFQINHKRGESGAWIAGGESEFDAVRPDVPFNKHFWDRNGVLDSYEGSLLGVFNSETWLLNGAVFAAQAGAGIWEAGTVAGCRWRAALGYHYLLLEANSRLTRRQTTLLFSVDEQNFETTYPTVEADLIPVQLELSRAWGDFRVDAQAGAELPARIRIYRSQRSGVKRPPLASEYSGGISAGFQIGYRLP